MAVPAAVAAATKKVAADLLTKKKTWVAIGSVIAGFAMLCLLPAMVLLSMANGISGIQLDQSSLQQQIMASITDEQKGKLLYVETVMTAIDSEVIAQGLAIEPIKAEVIYMCVLIDREKDNDTFYTDYISCFADAGNDDQIFANITEKLFLSSEKRSSGYN